MGRLVYWLIEAAAVLTLAHSTDARAQLIKIYNSERGYLTWVIAKPSCV
jgi:hypothetical protein